MKRKVISAILVAAMTASLVGCGGTQASSAGGAKESGTLNEDGTFELKSINLVINGTLTATLDNGQAEFEQQWEEAVGEKIGHEVDLQINQLDHSGYNDAVGRLFASQQYPDVILLSADQYAQYATTGLLWNMKDAYDNASFNSRIKYPEVNNALIRNGGLYGFAPAYGNGCVTYVKQAWLDAAGVTADSIKTYDDYYKMLIAFHDGDPDGNGITGDTYGVVGSGYISKEAPYINYLPEFWQDAYPALLQDDKGVWYDGFQTEATKAAIERIAQGVKDGAIDPTTLTNGTKDAREKWFSNNQSGSSGVFTYWAGTWYQTLTDNMKKNEVDTDIVEIAPIAEVGKYINREAPVFCIIDDMDGNDAREQAIFDAFFETMMDGGKVEMLWLYGAENTHWSISADDGFKTNEGTPDEKVYGPYADGEFHLLPTINDPNSVWKKNAVDPALVICPLEGDYSGYVEESSLMAEGNKFFIANMKDAPTSPSSEVYTNYAGDIQTAKETCIARVVQEGVDIETAMKEYVDTVGAYVEESLEDLNSQVAEGGEEAAQ